MATIVDTKKLRSAVLLEGIQKIRRHTSNQSAGQLNRHNIQSTGTGRRSELCFSQSIHPTEVKLGSFLATEYLGINLGTLEPSPPLIGHALLGRQCTPCLCLPLGTSALCGFNPAMMAILASPLLAVANSSVITIRH